MVRTASNPKRTLPDKIKIFLLSNLLKCFFKFEDLFFRYKRVNFPEIKPCIFALWHAHQCAIYCNKDKERLYALISPSNDGEIIAAGSKAMGIDVIRGSKGRRGVGSSIELLEKLEQGNSIAITVDGPKGPARKVKDGVINIAKLSQVPIIPMCWYSPEKTFLKFKTWDEFRVPIFDCTAVAMYGEPIYIPADIDKEGIEKYRLLLEERMKEIYADLKANYNQYVKQKDL